MLPIIYHLQKVSFAYGLTDLSYFVVAQHPDHAREIVAQYLIDLDFDHHKNIGDWVMLHSSVQFIATLVNNDNIIPCVLDL